MHVVFFVGQIPLKRVEFNFFNMHSIVDLYIFYAH
jgi:hypothetical protein